ncbi:hypothetical protein MRX96_005567 [Rhipicephalus microplus]
MGSLEHLAIALTVLVASGMRSYAEAAAMPDEQGSQDDQSVSVSTASNGHGPASPFGYLGGVVRDTLGNPEKVYNFVYGSADSVQQVARLYALMSIPVFQQQPTTPTKPATTTTRMTPTTRTSPTSLPTTTTTRLTTPPSTITNASQETGTASTEKESSSVSHWCL